MQNSLGATSKVTYFTVHLLAPDDSYPSLCEMHSFAPMVFKSLIPLQQQLKFQNFVISIRSWFGGAPQVLFHEYSCSVFGLVKLKRAVFSLHTQQW